MTVGEKQFPMTFGLAALALAGGAHSHRERNVHPMIPALGFAFAFRWSAFFFANRIESPSGAIWPLYAFVIVITGGLGSMPGALVGGVLIGLTEAIAGLVFTPSAKSMFAFAILVLVLLFRPQGIMGKRAA